MKKFRINNDINIHWDVLRLGDPEVFANKQVDVRLIGPNGAPCVIRVDKLEDGVVEVHYDGRHQKRTGMYTLLLVENAGKPEMFTVDEVNAFELVPHSYMSGGTDSDYVTTSSVQLTTNIELPMNGVDGADGDSAYDIAVENGFTGTKAEWLASLKGSDGQSAYALAVENGFEGDEAEWLASLKGSDGPSAYEVYKALREAEGKTVLTKQQWVDKLLAAVITARPATDDAVDVTDPSDDAADAVLYTPQTLTTAQQTIARQNINAADDDDIVITEDADMDIVMTDPTLLTTAVRTTPQTLSTNEKAQAQQNIGVADVARTEMLELKMALLDASGITVIGNIADLTTDDKTFIVNAINEVDAHADLNAEHIGDLTTLKTVEKDDIVSAINELKDASSVVLVKETTPNTDMAATYTLYSGVDDAGDPIEVGQIDIPLDKVAISGEVITADGTEVIGQEADGTSIRATAGRLYIVLTIGNDTKKVYIDADSLVVKPETVDIDFTNDVNI